MGAVDQRTKSILHPVNCVSCGYVLRGLQPRNNCPECGTPIEATTLAPLLKQRAPLLKQRKASRFSSQRPMRRFAAIVIALAIAALMLTLISRYAF